jgi:Tol biopolymer transport system component/DNA-binding winged helix-turn-helix (wHTH) protein
MDSSRPPGLDGKTTAWRFDNVVVSAALFRVTVDGVPRALEPRAFRLLQFLIENRQRTVSKEEIFGAVWAGTFVTDNALTRAVFQIRRAIGDDPRQPRYIETVPTIGYRFTARVEVEASAQEPTGPQEPHPRGKTPRLLESPVGAAAAIVLTVTVGLVFWVRSRGFPSRPGTHFAPVQFSASAGLDVSPSFSPDGGLVAYASDKSGSFEIYVKSFDPTAHELQVTNDANENLDPAFSPDGSWIAFTSVRRRGVFRVPATGGPTQRLTDFGAQPVWSPDGRTIVLRSNAGLSMSTTDYYAGTGSNLWMVPAVGGTPVQITGLDGQPPGEQGSASFSPDGAEIRFLNRSGQEASIWTCRIADGKLHKRFASTTLLYGDPTFSRDGTRMWFVDPRLNGDFGISELPLDPRTLAPTGTAESVYPAPFAVPRSLKLSADGARLAFTAVLSRSAIVAQAIPPHASGPVSLTRETSFRYAMARSAPDGSRVIYTSVPRGGPSREWVVNADGSEPVALGARDAVSEAYGCLTADNSHALFAEYRDRKGRLMSQRLADGALQQLTELPPYAANIACSRDGTSLVFHDLFAERRKVYRLDLQAGAPRVIATGGEDIGYARFSRDDKWISVEVFHRPLGGNDVAVLSAEGGPLDVVLKSDQPTFTGGWMPDNDRILFAGFRDGAWNVYTVSRTTHAVGRLTSYASMRTYVRYPDWLTGDRIVYEFNESTGNIFVADVRR